MVAILDEVQTNGIHFRIGSTKGESTIPAKFGSI